jgi:hypothetical protein
MSTDPVQKYYDALISSYDVLSEAATKAGQLGVKVGERVSSDIAKGQREALELGRKLAANPGDVTQLYTQVLEATTAAQGRALEFVQVAYQESLSAGTDLRQTFEKLVEANRETAQAAAEAVRNTIAKTPFAAAVNGTEKTAAKKSA